MNADVRRQVSEIEPLGLCVPEAALMRLQVRLGQAVTSGEALAACSLYGAPWSALCDALEYFETSFELEQQVLFGLPCFETRAAGERLCFLHARSNEHAALPLLLLLHGYSASLAEFQNQVLPLTTASAGRALHVVCPSLPGFGLSRGEPCPRAAAKACAALMARLGYTRYLVHGSDLGAKVALELAGFDSAHVAALHVTTAPAYPLQTELPQLTPTEKSQLALLTELHEAPLPESPVEELALAVSQLDQQLGPAGRELLGSLLTGLLLSWAFSSRDQRAALYGRRLEPAPASCVPLALNAFPLGVPNLRRFTAQRYRIAEWHEHQHGGSMPALEQPELWLESLRTCAGKLL